MPNIQSAKKRVRQSVDRTARNKQYATTIKKGLKRMTKMSQDKAEKSVGEMHSVIQKAAQRGVIHKNKAKRLMSRVSKVSKLAN